MERITRVTKWATVAKERWNDLAPKIVQQAILEEKHCKSIKNALIEASGCCMNNSIAPRTYVTSIL